MAYRNLAGIDEKILRTIWLLGAKDGAKKVTARKVGVLCGVSDYTVFCHFGNSNQGFLDAAAKHFFTLHIEPFLQRFSDGATFKELWDDVLDDFLAESDGARYFQSYCAAFGVSEELFPMQHRKEAAAALTAHLPSLRESERLILAEYFFSCAFHYAEHIASGTIPGDDIARSFLRTLICRAFDETK